MKRFGSHRKIRELQEQMRKTREILSEVSNNPEMTVSNNPEMTVPRTAPGNLQSTPGNFPEERSSPTVRVHEQDRAEKLQGGLEEENGGTNQVQEVQQTQSMQNSSPEVSEVLMGQLDQDKDDWDPEALVELVERLRRLVEFERTRAATLLEEKEDQACSQEILVSQFVEEHDKVGKLQSELEVERRDTKELHDALAVERSAVKELQDVQRRQASQLVEEQDKVWKLQNELAADWTATDELHGLLAAERMATKQLRDELAVERSATKQSQDVQQRQSTQLLEEQEKVRNLQMELEAERNAIQQSQDVQQRQSTQLVEEQEKVRNLQTELEAERKALQQLHDVQQRQASQLVSEQEKVRNLQTELEAERKATEQLHNVLAVERSTTKQLQDVQQRQSTELSSHLSSQKALQQEVDELHEKMGVKTSLHQQEVDELHEKIGVKTSLHEFLTSQYAELQDLQQKQHAQLASQKVVAEKLFESQLSHWQKHEEKLRYQLEQERNAVSELREQMGAQAASLELLMSQRVEDRDQVARLWSELEEEVRAADAAAATAGAAAEQLASKAVAEELLEAQLVQGQSHVEELHDELAKQRTTVGELQEEIAAQASSHTSKLVQEWDQVGQLRSELDFEKGYTKQLQELNQKHHLDFEERKRIVAEQQEQIDDYKSQAQQLISNMEAECRASEKATEQLQDIQQQQLTSLSPSEDLDIRLAQGQNEVDRLRHEMELERIFVAELELQEQLAAQASSQELLASHLVEQRLEVGQLRSELEVERTTTLQMADVQQHGQVQQFRLAPQVDVLAPQVVHPQGEGAGSLSHELEFSRAGVIEKKLSHVRLQEQIMQMAAQASLNRSQLIEKEDLVAKLQNELEAEREETKDIRSLLVEQDQVQKLRREMEEKRTEKISDLQTPLSSAVTSGRETQNVQQNPISPILGRLETFMLHMEADTEAASRKVLDAVEARVTQERRRMENLEKLCGNMDKLQKGEGSADELKVPQRSSSAVLQPTWQSPVRSDDSTALYSVYSPSSIQSSPALHQRSMLSSPSLENCYSPSSPSGSWQYLHPPPLLGPGR